MLRVVSEKKWNKITKNLAKANEQEIQELHDFLIKFHTDVYKELHRIFKLPDDDSLWDRYVSMGLEDLPEQILFREQAELAKAFLSQLPKRASHGKEKGQSTLNDESEESVNGVGIRSSKTGSDVSDS